MTALVFVDTNVLLYALDTAVPEKQRAAAAWRAELWRSRRGRVSYQVLQEFYVQALRKEPKRAELARAEVRDLFAWEPVAVDADVIQTAWGFQARFSLSFWDALIVAAAHTLQCRFLLTEDLSHGQDLGGVRVVNPFRVAPSELRDDPAECRDTRVSLSRAADTRLGALLALLLLAVNILSVASELGFLHKAKQVKEYDHWRYIEMARGPEGNPELQREPPYCFRLAVPALARGLMRLGLPENAAFYLITNAALFGFLLLLWLHLRDLGFSLPLRVTGLLRDRLHAGSRALVRVPVLDERPRGALPGDAGLLPRRAREVARRLGRQRRRRVRARDLRPRVPVRLPARAAPGAALLRGTRPDGRDRRAAVRDPRRDPQARHAQPARRFRCGDRRQHDLPPRPRARQPALRRDARRLRRAGAAACCSSRRACPPSCAATSTARSTCSPSTPRS